MVFLLYIEPSTVSTSVFQFLVIAYLGYLGTLRKAIRKISNILKKKMSTDLIMQEFYFMF